MQTIIEYIMLNYIWIIVGSIIILLAIIGYYADKTNFGQGKKLELDSKDTVDVNSLQGKRMDDLFENNKDVSKKTINYKENNKTLNNSSLSKTTLDNKVKISQNIASQIDSLNHSEEKFEEFEKEFNELLPKKEIIDDSLLDEVNNLNLDRTQKIQINDVPKMDDVELPEIKTLPLEKDDVWKF